MKKLRTGGPFIVGIIVTEPDIRFINLGKVKIMSLTKSEFQVAEEWRKLRTLSRVLSETHYSPEAKNKIIGTMFPHASKFAAAPFAEFLEGVAKTRFFCPLVHHFPAEYKRVNVEGERENVSGESCCSAVASSHWDHPRFSENVFTFRAWMCY